MLCGSLCSIFRLIPHSYAQHIEIVTFVLVIDSGDVRNLPLARTTPACPEIYQNVFSFSYKIRELHCTCRILRVLKNGKICEHLSFRSGFLGSDGLFEADDKRIGISNFALDHTYHLLKFICLKRRINLLKSDYRHRTGRVLLYDRLRI